MEKSIGLFAILQTLATQSDKSHPISRSKIMENLENTYDVTMERRCFYRIRLILDHLGYPSKYDDSAKGYYLDPPLLSRGEELMIWNAIHSARFLSESESQILLDKINRFCSDHHYNEFKETVYMKNPKKTTNAELMHNIEIAEEAISKRKKMSFYYLHYDKSLILVRRDDKPTIIEPRYIVYQDARPYLIVTGRKESKITHYRIDKISEAKMLAEDSDPGFKTQDAYDYAKNKLFMFSGEMIKVHIRCKKRILDAMIDIFGTDLILIDRDPLYYEFSVEVNENGVLYLAQQFLDAVEILSPSYIRRRIRDNLCKAYTMYLS